MLLVDNRQMDATYDVFYDYHHYYYYCYSWY